MGTAWRRGGGREGMEGQRTQGKGGNTWQGGKELTGGVSVGQHWDNTRDGSRVLGGTARALTLVIEAIDAVDAGTLVVAPQQEEVLRVLDLVGEQQADGLQ